jgi:hypothetical protein
MTPRSIGSTRPRPLGLITFALFLILLAAAFATWSSASAIPPGTVTFAVTFDTTSPSGWLHTSMTSGKPVGSVLGAAIPRTSRPGGTETIPSYVRAVPGVSATDSSVGLFPAYSSTLTAQSAYTVRPSVFGSGEALAPGKRRFVVGADLRLDTASTTGSSADNGNNVVQRGISTGDQYKVQVDPIAGVLSVTCILRDEGTISSRPAPIAVEPGHWLRARCTRDVIGGGEQVTLNVTYPGGEIANPPSSVVTSPTVTNLDFANASASSPIPLAVGAKVNNDGTRVLASDSDQFNGRIDNAYLKIE